MLDYSKIDDVEIEGIDYGDSPDFCDAYVSRARYDDPKHGYRQLTDDELESLDVDWVHEQVESWIY
jgi:hypothetical protein